MDYVALSGGVDSTALALLMADAVPVFTDTGAEFPETYAHLARFEDVTGRAIVRVQRDGGLLEYIERARFLPSHGARYCTRLFKIDPMNTYLADRLPATLNIGLRADEPQDMRIGNLTDMEGLTIRYPLREQGIDRRGCLAICLDAGLLPRYPVYMARGGCMNCFYKRASEVHAMIALVPAVMDQLQALEESVQDERGTFFHMFPNAGASIRDMRAQGTLFDPAEVYADAAETIDVGAACGLFCHR